MASTQLRAHHPWIHAELRRVAAQARLAAAAVQRARGMREVHAAASLSVPGWLQPLVRQTAEWRALDAARQRRLAELAVQHLAQLRELSAAPGPAVQARIESFVRLRTTLWETEWCYLRGPSSGLLAQLEREAEQLLSRLRGLQHSESAASPGG